MQSHVVCNTHERLVADALSYGRMSATKPTTLAAIRRSEMGLREPVLAY